MIDAGAIATGAIGLVVIGAVGFADFRDTLRARRRQPCASPFCRCSAGRACDGPALAELAELARAEQATWPEHLEVGAWTTPATGLPRRRRRQPTGPQPSGPAS